MKKYWVAMVVGQHPETKRVHFSFLAFWALNRFEALKQLRKSLPDNTELLESNGNLIPFKIIELKVIEEKQHEMYLLAFNEMVHTFTSGAYISFGKVS